MPPKPAFPEPAATLPGERDLLAAVVADLSDDTARLVYSDWLDERDDRRGKLLRDSLAAYRAGKKLPPTKGFPKPWCDVVGLTLLAKAKAAGLIDHADTFLRLGRPALTFKSARVADAKLPVGTSKLGGRADLSAAFKWPMFRNEPLAFLAQYNLGELAASVACRDLPRAGVLSVFYDASGETFDSADKGGWRVVHFPGTTDLIRRELPAGLNGTYHSCRLSFTEGLTLPHRDSPWEKELDFGEDSGADDAYGALHEGDRLGHRILGYPHPLQNDVLGRKTNRHLLSIDSDDGPDWMWGDAGLLYFTMSEENLKAGKFDKVKFEMQCC